MGYEDDKMCPDAGRVFPAGTMAKRVEDDGTVRKFTTGATRDTAEGKLDFEAYLCPRVLKSYAEYMLGHQTASDGSHREGDNWQKGIPARVYRKSMWRHFFDVWFYHRCNPMAPRSAYVTSLNALLFNVMGLLHEELKP